MIFENYKEFLATLDKALQKGAVADDISKGYSLSTYLPLRAIQLQLRAYAVRHERLLRDVLRSSVDSRQRTVAAQMLGYARQSKRQMTALVRASRDADADVRNNATRALVVMVRSDPALAGQIPPESFIRMLLSGIWTDVNKGGELLSDLTAGRDPILLARLHRSEVPERLIEMARWQTAHAHAARTILGRLAGIQEKRLQQLVASDAVEMIVAAWWYK